MVVFIFRLVVFCIVARFRFGTVLLYFELLYVLNIQTDVLLLFFRSDLGCSIAPNVLNSEKSKGGLTRHIAVKHSENPEKENTQKETRKDRYHGKRF